MESKNNYQKDLLELLNGLSTLCSKPKLLLHACCGPCFTLPYEQLKDYFDVTIIYNNSNIYPEDEYYRRLNELKFYLAKNHYDIKVIEVEYDNATYNKDLEEFANEREGGMRCRLCFQKRLEFGFRYASQNCFDYFGTVMTISRYKNSQIINKIGLSLQAELGSKTKWLPADFKKDDGYKKSLEIVRKNEMYFQNYCGCKYSIRDTGKKQK